MRKKFTSFGQVLKEDAHKRKSVPFFCLAVYMQYKSYAAAAAAAAADTTAIITYSR